MLHEPDGPFVVFTTSVPALQHPAARTADGSGWAYGLFGYVAATRHAGDRSAAARDARAQRNSMEMRTSVLASAHHVARTLDAPADGDEYTDLPPLLAGIADGTLTLVQPTILEVTPTT